MARKDIMLCYPFEEKRLKKWKPPYLIQPKLDGLRCRAVPVNPDHDESPIVLLSSEGNVFDLPHITSILEKLPFRFEFDGELYNHELDFETLCSMTKRTVTTHPKAYLVEFHIFDIISEAPQGARTSALWTLSDRFPHPIKRVPTVVARNMHQVMLAYQGYLDAGYEGIIIRDHLAPYIRRRSTQMMKFKPKRSDTYQIVGYEEEISIHGRPKDRLGSLLVRDPEGNTFSVGSGLTEADRIVYWDRREDLIGQTAQIAYQNLTTGRKVPRFPVLVDILWRS